MRTPTPLSCRSAAKPLGTLRAATLAATVLASASTALANDRDLRGTPVPAAACIVNDGKAFQQPGLQGWFSVANNVQLTLRCALPVNNVELSSTSNDNDISKFRVHYRDSNGFDSGTAANVQLVETIVTASILGAQSTIVCTWNSNTDGT